MTTRAPAVLKIKSVKNTRYREKGDGEWRKYFPPLEARLVESGLVHSKEPFSKTGFHNFKSDDKEKKIYFAFKYLDRPSIGTELPESPGKMKSFWLFLLKAINCLQNSSQEPHYLYLLYGAPTENAAEPV